MDTEQSKHILDLIRTNVRVTDASMELGAHMIVQFAEGKMLNDVEAERIYERMITAMEDFRKQYSHVRMKYVRP